LPISQELFAPGTAQHADPVVLAELPKHFASEAPRQQRFAKICQSGDVADRLRHLGAVKIGSEADAVDPNLLNKMVEMPEQDIKPGVRIDAPIGTQKAGRKINADHAAAIPDRRQLAIGEIA